MHLQRSVRTRRSRLFRSWVGSGALSSLTAVVVMSGCGPDPGRPGRPADGEQVDRPRPRICWPPQAVWVPRRVYTSADEIASFMKAAREAGFNAVLWQVRGNATTFYRSKIDPIAEEFGPTLPDFDPLAVACAEAHRHGLDLHAWVNVMPAWRGNAPPTDPRQVYNAHPEWLWYDQHGRRQPLGEFYVSLNPCLPEVRKYLVDVCREIIRSYPVDGLHLDYIRFPNEHCPARHDYPRDKRTLALYREATGKRPDDDRARWNQWRTEQVTQLVRDIRSMCRQVRPGLRLTAACMANVDEAQEHRFQDGAAWLRAGLLDAVFLMNYTKDTGLYRQRHERFRSLAGGRMTIPGIGVYLHDHDRQSIEQLQWARTWGHGCALFSSNVLLDGSRRSRERLAAISPVLHDMRNRQHARGQGAVADGVSVGVSATTTLQSTSNPRPHRRPRVP